MPKSAGTDAWGWESLLWLGFGVGIRNGTFSGGAVPTTAVPPSTKEVLDYAAGLGVKLMAYVYPTLAFQPKVGAKPPWLFPKGCSGRGCNGDLSMPLFQEYVGLVQF